MTFAADDRRDVEQAVIGAVLHDATTLALLPALSSTDFHGPFARVIWDSIRNLETKNLPIDVVTIGDEVTRTRRARHGDNPDADRTEVTIWTYLSECALQTPSTTHAIEYGRRVRDRALGRRVAETLGEVLAAWRDQECSGSQLLSMALAGLSLLDAEQPERVSTIGEIVQRRLAQLEEIQRLRREGHPALAGAPTGIAGLDDKIAGWQHGIVSIVAARPGHGKSSLGLATADAATKAGVGVQVFSLEDMESAYADRAMARGSSVPAESIRNGTLAHGQMKSLQATLAELSKRPGWLFDDRSGISAQEIVRSVRRHKKANGTRVVIVDYVQLVAASAAAQHRQASAHEVLTEVITTLADAAKQDGIAYVVMSQLNRKLEERTDKRPMLSDLRESGSLEERAKCVVGIYRGAAVHQKPQRGVDYVGDCPPSDEEFQRDVQLLVLKNSNGQTGRVRATWNGPTTRME